MSLTVKTGTTFQAPHPQAAAQPNLARTAASYAWNAVTTVSLSNAVHGKLISMLANGVLEENKDALRGLKKKLTGNANDVQIVQFKTPNGAAIEAAFYPPKNPGSGQAIVFALGSGGAFEKIADDKDVLRHVIAFLQERFGDDTAILVPNYEGIGDSQGSPSFDNWSDDLYAAQEFLRNENYPNIVLYGHSLGAHLSLKACEKIFQRHRAIPDAVCDRGFANTQEFIYQYVGQGAVGRIAQGAVAYAGLSSNAAKLDGQRVLFILAEDDPTIPRAASLGSKYEKTANGNDVQVLKIKDRDEPFSSHTRALSAKKDEADKVTDFIKAAFNRQSSSSAQKS